MVKLKEEVVNVLAREYKKPLNLAKCIPIIKKAYKRSTHKSHEKTPPYWWNNEIEIHRKNSIKDLRQYITSNKSTENKKGNYGRKSKKAKVSGGGGYAMILKMIYGETDTIWQ